MYNPHRCITRTPILSFSANGMHYAKTLHKSLIDNVNYYSSRTKFMKTLRWLKFKIIIVFFVYIYHSRIVLKFYHDILNYAQEIFLHPKCKCIIWNNRLIKVENKSLFLKNWYEKGIVYIHDLLNEEGTWLSYDQFQNKLNNRTNF